MFQLWTRPSRAAFIWNELVICLHCLSYSLAGLQTTKK